MARVGRYALAALIFCAVAAGALAIRPAGAVKPFMAEFKALYVKPNTQDHTMQIFNAAVEKKGCTICHRGRASKPTKAYNAYGEQLKKLLNAKRDAGNPETIRAALKKVATMRTNPDDPDSPTYAQRLRDGKLPVGEIHVRSKSSANQAPAEK